MQPFPLFRWQSNTRANGVLKRKESWLAATAHLTDRNCSDYAGQSDFSL
jgi:hypothetical protein